VPSNTKNTLTQRTTGSKPSVGTTLLGRRTAVTAISANRPKISMPMPLEWQSMSMPFSSASFGPSSRWKISRSDGRSSIATPQPISTTPTPSRISIGSSSLPAIRS
jgi:hypothetical protein